MIIEYSQWSSHYMQMYHTIIRFIPTIYLEKNIVIIDTSNSKTSESQNQFTATV